MKKLFFLALCILSAPVAKSQPSDAYILSLMNAQKMPGIGAAILKDTLLVWQKSWGKRDLSAEIAVDQNTIFMMASVSKSIIPTALMQLWEQGLFQLDDNINNYLPFTIHNPHFPNDSISFRMLMTHTSSLKDNWNVLGDLYVSGDSPISLDTLLFNYFDPSGYYYHAAQNFYNFKPGASSKYSNIGATLAAYLVERITGIPYDQYCNAHIFTPLCMNHTSFKLAGFTDTSLIARPYSWYGGNYHDNGLYGYPDYPDGQLRTTVNDLSRYLNMYMNQGIFQGERILDSATVQIILTEQYPLVPGAAGQGLIFYQYINDTGDVLWGHNGGDAGVSTDMYFDMISRTGVLVFGNGDGDGNLSVDPIFDTLYQYGKTIVPLATDTFPACSSITGAQAIPSKKAVSIQIFPNPTSGILHLETGNIPDPVFTVKIFNANGQPVMVKGCDRNENTRLDVRGFSKGVYYIYIKSATAYGSATFLKE